MPTLASLSTINSPSGRGKDAYAKLIEGSPFARSLEVYGAWDKERFDFSWEPLEEESSAPARAIGAAFTAENRVPKDRVSQSQRIHGDATEMDIAYLADAGTETEGDVMISERVGEKISVFAESWESEIFNADGSSNKYKGIKTILDGTTTLPGYTDTFRVKDAVDVSSVSNAKSLDVSTTAGMKGFIELLQNQLKDVRNPSAIYMNPSLAGRLDTAGFDSGRLIGTTVDQFGKEIRTFRGVPIIEVLDTTILLNEPDNTSTPLTNTTSLYIVGWMTKRMALVTNSGLYYTDYDHLQAKEKGKEQWEIRAAWKIRDPKRIKRIRNIKL